MYRQTLLSDFEKVYKNTAEVSNKGFDFRINGLILAGKDLKWTLHP